jgi:RNA polymerase sigma factor (sigma-70 family)
MSHSPTSLTFLGEPTDRELLRQFVHQRDEAAFARVVSRHGPMVLGAAYRVLGNEHDAEDVFQATFLILARKADSPAWHESVGNYLYLVARRLARKTQEQNARRRAHEQQAGQRPVHQPTERGAWVDEELERLPEKYRAPLLLCYLEEATRDEAAQQLGLSLGTLKRRLEQARQRLRQRLLERGLCLPPLLALHLLLPARSTRLSSLSQATVGAAKRALSGEAVEEVISPGAVALAEGGLRAMGMQRLQVIALLLLLGVVTVGTALAIQRTPATNPGSASPAPPKEFPPRPGENPLQQGVVAAREKRPQMRGSLVTKQELLRLEGSGLANSLAFSPDSTLLAAGCANRQRVVVRDVISGKELHRFKTPGSWLIIHTIAFSPDGKTLAAASGVSNGNGIIYLWDLASGRLRKFGGPYEACWAFAFSPDGKRIAMANSDDFLRVVDVQSGHIVYRIRGGTSRITWGVAFSPDGTLLATHENDCTIRLHQAQTGKLLRQCLPPDLEKIPKEKRPRFDGMFTRIAFTPDGQTVAARGKDGSVLLWDVATGKLRRQLKRPDPVEQAGDRLYQSYVAFAPRGEMVAVAGAPPSRGRVKHQVKGGLSLLDARTGKLLHSFSEAGRSDFTSVAFSPDGTLLAAADHKLSGGAVHVWGLRTGAVAGKPGERKRLTAKQQDLLWTALASPEDRTAFRASFFLGAAPADTLLLLEKRLDPVPVLTSKRLDRLLKALDSENFKTREAATEELEQIGQAITPALREVLASTPSPEVRRRVQRILARQSRGPGAAEQRALRAVNLLEEMGGPRARTLRKRLARGAGEARLTRKARVALERMGEKQGSKP